MTNLGTSNRRLKIEQEKKEISRDPINFSGSSINKLISHSSLSVKKNTKPKKDKDGKVKLIDPSKEEDFEDICEDILKNHSFA